MLTEVSVKDGGRALGRSIFFCAAVGMTQAFGSGRGGFGSWAFHGLACDLDKLFYFS